MSEPLSLIRSVARRGLARLQAVLRIWNGDAAYACYLEHWRAAHGEEHAPLDRGQFFRRETERRWNGIRRCC